MWAARRRQRSSPMRCWGQCNNGRRQKYGCNQEIWPRSSSGRAGSSRGLVYWGFVEFGFVYFLTCCLHMFDSSHHADNAGGEVVVPVQKRRGADLDAEFFVGMIAHDDGP